MKKTLLHSILIIAISVILNTIAWSQTVIDYSTSSTACNSFASVTNVSGIPLLSAIGQPTKDSNGEAISLLAKVVNSSDIKGTEYRITYNFKKGYSYKITVNAKRDPNPSSGGNVNLRFDLNNGGSGTSPTCNSAQSIDAAISGNLKNSKQISSNQYLNYTFDYTILSSAYSYMMVAAVPAGTLMIDQTIYIKKITIEETAPELELSPATLPTTCGVSTNQTFTVSNPSGLENITSYEWNLGSANNGWLYNGSPAPQSITTTTNSLALTSVCNAATVNNVGVTIKVNNVNYKSYSSAISRTAASPVINGNPSICSGSGAYSIDNLPCDATVTWSATGNTTFSGGINTGSSVTIDNNSSETITLTANITSSCGNFTRTKTINVGVPYFSSGITTSWDGPGQYVVGINTPVHATIDTPYPNATEYSWYLEPYPDAQFYIDNNLPVPSGTTFGSGTHCILTFDVPGDYTMMVKAHTPCGDTNFIGVGYFAVDTSIYDGGYSYAVSPNPSSNELTVSLNKDIKNPISFRESSINKEPTKITLYNDKGKILREGFIQPQATSITFATQDIPAGNYYLHIIRPDKKVTKKQIVIKH